MSKRRKAAAGAWTQLRACATDETSGYEIFNEADAKDYIPIGMELEIDGRKFVIDSVNYGADEVSLRDVTFQSHTG